MTVTCNAIIHSLGDLEDLVERLSRLSKGSNPEFAVPLEIWMDETVGKLATHRWIHWDEADEGEANEGRDPDYELERLRDAKLEDLP